MKHAYNKDKTRLMFPSITQIMGASKLCPHGSERHVAWTWHHRWAILTNWTGVNSSINWPTVSCAIVITWI